MKELELPDFKTRAEEAAFWDQIDLGPYMADAVEVTLEWTERDDRCRRCGGGMDTRHTDLQIAGGRVVLRGAPIYVCRTPGCGNTQLPAAVAGIVTQIESLVDELLAPQEAESPESTVHPLWETKAAVPALAAVREEQADYDAD